MTDQRTKLDVIRELGQLQTEAQDNREKGKQNPADLMGKIANLRHEIKKFDTVTAKGGQAEAIKAHWARQVEEEKKKQAQEKKNEEVRIKEAKRRLKKDKGVVAELAEGLSTKELEAILAKKKARLETKKFTIKKIKL